jgi:glycerate dehydrogenase
MGLVGFGRIGRRVGMLAHAMGMNVIAYDAFKVAAPEYTPFAFKSVDELFSQADVVSMHAPLTPENTGMVNKALLGKMKSGAMLINTARGPLVNEVDLAEALNSGKLAGAALDVVSAEPIKADNPLLKAKNVILTPHIAWATLSARRRLMQTTVENVAAIIKGQPINLVN